MNRSRVTGGTRLAQLLGFVLLLASCSSGASAAEELKQAAAVTRGADSFVLTTRVSGEVSLLPGQPLDSSGTLWYLAPDRMRFLSSRSQGPALEHIVIGDRAWTRSDSGWASADAGFVRRVALEPITGLVEGFLAGDLPARTPSRLGDGPQLAGEPTRVYGVADPQFGERMIAGLRTRVAAEPSLRPSMEPLLALYSEVSVRAEYTVGVDSHRIYRASFVLGGPNMQQSAEMSFRYDQPVTIEPPVP